MKLNLAKNLAPLKETAILWIEQQAEAERGKYITLGPGQAMVYLEKEKEARAFLADTTQDHDLFPHLDRESTILNLDMTQLAETVVAMSDQWRYVSSIIEPKRLLHKAMVNAATTPAEIEAATVIDWSVE